MSSAVATLAVRSVARRLALGFIAGAIAVLIAHQVMILLLYLGGQIANPPYSFRSNPYGVPQIINQMFWGGLWGVLYAFVVSMFPRGWPTWAKGVVFGLGIHVILGNWLVIAMMRSQPLFGGLSPRMWIGAAIGTAFGLGVAYVHAILSGRQER